MYLTMAVQCMLVDISNIILVKFFEQTYMEMLRQFSKLDKSGFDVIVVELDFSQLNLAKNSGLINWTKCLRKYLKVTN